MARASTKLDLTEKVTGNFRRQAAVCLNQAPEVAASSPQAEMKPD